MSTKDDLDALGGFSPGYVGKRGGDKKDQDFLDNLATFSFSTKRKHDRWVSSDHKEYLKKIKAFNSGQVGKRRGEDYAQFPTEEDFQLVPCKKNSVCSALDVKGEEEEEDDEDVDEDEEGFQNIYFPVETRDIFMR